MKLIGFPVVHLQVAADRPDANIFAYLEQVGPDGATQVISFGRLALSHRRLSKPPYDTLNLPYHSGLAADVAPLGPGQRAQLDFDLTPVSQVVPAGSRLRVTITGADPRQRNLKQIMQTPAPTLTVFRGGPTESRIDLPVEP